MAKFLDAVGLNYFWSKVKTALNDKLDKTGGTLTGNLDGKHITGTLLRTSADNSLNRRPLKICVQHDGGVYTRTTDQFIEDLGITAQGERIEELETNLAPIKTWGDILLSGRHKTWGDLCGKS